MGRRYGPRATLAAFLFGGLFMTSTSWRPASCGFVRFGVAGGSTICFLWHRLGNKMFAMADRC